MVGHHHETAAGAQDALRGFEELFESRQLAIDLDTQGLEDAGELLLLLVRTHQGADDGDEIPDGLQRCRGTSLHDALGDLTALLQLAIAVEDIGKSGFVILVQEVTCRAACAVIHAHIQEWRLVTEAKATLHIIEVMGGDTEVSQERIHLPQLLIVVHEALKMAEVRGDEREALCLLSSCRSIRILVEGVEMPAVREAIEYGT